MSGEVFVVAEIAGAAVVMTAGFAARTALAGTTLALEGVAALGEHIDTVVARAEERHREACRWGAAASGVLDRNARLAVLAAAGARAGVTTALPEPLDPHGHDTEELLRWCARTDERIRAIDEEITRAEAAALTGVVLADLAKALGAARPGEPPRTAEALADVLAHQENLAPAWRETAATEDFGQTLTRILGRLPPHADPRDREAIRAAAARLAEAAGPAEAASRLMDIRHRVRLAATRAAERRHNAVEAARLLQALEHDDPGGDHGTLLADLADVVAGRREFDPGLRAAARAACAAVVAAADEQHLRRSLLDALGALGYQAEEGFETLRPIRLTRDDWDEHAVTLVVTGEGRVRSAVIRTALGDGHDTDAADAEHERQWCVSFEKARAALADQGIATTVERLVPPGSRPTPVAVARAERARRIERRRSRERPS